MSSVQQGGPRHEGWLIDEVVDETDEPEEDSSIAAPTTRNEDPAPLLVENGPVATGLAEAASNSSILNDPSVILTRKMDLDAGGGSVVAIVMYMLQTGETLRIVRQQLLRPLDVGNLADVAAGDVVTISEDDTTLVSVRRAEPFTRQLIAISRRGLMVNVAVTVGRQDVLARTDLDGTGTAERQGVTVGEDGLKMVAERVLDNG